MPRTAGDEMILFLEDGSSFRGKRLGAEAEAVGEVVFNTSMTGYQEMLMDPSYRGQMLIFTYPLIGNYGIQSNNAESAEIQIAGLVAREVSNQPSHNLSEETLHDYLVRSVTPGISGVDTRAIVRHIRSKGVMMGLLTPNCDRTAALNKLESTPRYGTVDLAACVSTPKKYAWSNDPSEARLPFREMRGRRKIRLRANLYPRITVVDYGVKFNIIRSLRARGCEVVVQPISASLADIASTNPDGVVLSPGPGDPSVLDRATTTSRRLAEEGIPVLGICLGHQILARAFGASTFKLPFGHRGGNQPVKDLRTGRVYITAQNHGYAVETSSLPPEFETTHLNLNDGTNEGLMHTKLPVMTIQYHSEASPGPHDSEYIFDKFLELVVEVSSGARGCKT